MKARRFTQGCPVAAVTVDLDREAGPVGRVCAEIFDNCRDAVAEGLHDVPARERRAVAELILATLEGAMILVRAHASPAPLHDAGDALAAALDARFRRSPMASSKARSPLPRSRATRSDRWR